MKWHEYRTFWQLTAGARRAAGATESRDDYYLSLVERLEKSGIESHLASFMWAAEISSYHAGRPYYAIEPDLLDAMVRTPLDIPSELLNVPHFGFEIRLPDTGPRLLLNDHGVARPVTALCVCDLKRYPGAVRAAGFDDVYKGFHAAIAYSIQVDDPERPVAWAFSFKSEIPIETQLVGANKWGTAAGEEALPILRLVVSLCLLATSASRLLDRDVLNRDRARYNQLAPNSAEAQSLVDRAVRNGRNGWRVTSERMRIEAGMGRDLNPDPAFDGSRNDPEGATSRELYYTHTRGAHWHRFPAAKDPKKRVQFLLPCLVRPDLPAKPLADDA